MLHLVAQMVGKTRLALAPPQPNWLHACLFLDSRGFTTGAMPYGGGVVTIGIDVHDSSIGIEVSDGRRAMIQLGRGRSVAEVWTDFTAALAELGIHVKFSDKPQEIADATPFSTNTYDCTFVPEEAQRFHRLLCAIDGAFEEFRSSFYGRSGVQFWWGSFTFCVLLFSGRRIPAPDDGGLIRRHDLDAEQMNAGFWPGDESTPDPIFFAYLVPQPSDSQVAPMLPAGATWSDALGERVLPYDAIRAVEDPARAITQFLESVYRVAVTPGGWDEASLRHEPPGKRKDREPRT
jgi:hypothetical protein